MRHRLHLRADPVENTEALLQGVEPFHVLSEDVEEVGQVVGLELAVHEALSQPDVCVLGDAMKELAVKHPHPRVVHLPPALLLSLSLLHKLLLRVPVHDFRPVGHDESEGAPLDGPPCEPVHGRADEAGKEGHVGGGWAGYPGDSCPHLFHHVDRRLHAILVEAVAAPCSAEPGPPDSLNAV
eukprot:753374-Hanusia_phi.AAC.12